jgi:hypothetical protein
MPDFLIIDGDQAVFLPSFGAATVVVRPGKMMASGQTTHKGMKICVEGDEGKVMVPGCMYVAPPYVIPGVGTLQIESLAGDQLTQKTKSGGKKIIMKGSMFNAKFQVSAPAQQPAPPGPPVPDGNPQYSGKGQFVTTNIKFKVS